MEPNSLLRSCAWAVAFQLLAVAAPNAASSQPLVPGAPEPAPELRERLARAAEDASLPPWQRDFMRGLAHGDGPAAARTAADGLRSAPSGRASASATDGSWEELVVGSRYSHSAIYDPVRDRMVVFGGQDGVSDRNDVWALSLADPPAWTELTPDGAPPGGRYGHSAIYDPVRDRMVVFAGAYGSCLDDAWALSLADPPAWTELMPDGTPPSIRYLHSAIYDPARDRMLVFGGTDGYYRNNEVWSLTLSDTPAWTLLAPGGTPPSTRYAHSAVYDPVRDRMVVFGGYGTALDEAWALSLAGTPAWAALSPTGTPPGAGSYHSAIYDPVRDRMVAFAGTSDYGEPLNGTWTLALAATPAWTALTPACTPPGPRDLHAAIFDPVRDRMVVFGGFQYPNALDDVWSVSLAGTPAWTALTPAGTPPSARYGLSAIYDPVRDRVLGFGGHGGSGRRNDVWALALAGTPAWTELTPSGTPPSARSGHSAIYDPVRDRVLVFGGSDDSGLRNDVWALALTGSPAWTALAPGGAPPPVRSTHSAIYDPVRDRMVVFGGGAGSYPFFINYDDVWALSLGDPSAWTPLTPTGGPRARKFHSAIYDPARDRMVVFAGGTDYGYAPDEAWALALGEPPAWTGLTPAGSPPSLRVSHSAIYDPARDRMVVFGGYDGYFRNDLWALRWSTPAGVGGQETRAPVSGLRPPAPNPSRGATTLSFSIARAGRVQLGVYDLGGRLVRRLMDGERQAGTGTVVWDGTGDSGSRLGTGVYFVRLTGPGISAARALVRIR